MAVLKVLFSPVSPGLGTHSPNSTQPRRDGRKMHFEIGHVDQLSLTDTLAREVNLNSKLCQGQGGHHGYLNSA